MIRSISKRVTNSSTIFYMIMMMLIVFSMSASNGSSAMSYYEQQGSIQSSFREMQTNTQNSMSDSWLGSGLYAVAIYPMLKLLEWSMLSGMSFGFYHPILGKIIGTATLLGCLLALLALLAVHAKELGVIP